MFRTDDRGFAIVMAMFMTLLVSALAASMTFVARTETESTQSYTTMAQARYAAESGLAAAANYLLSADYADLAPGSAGDPIANYTQTTSPVLLASGGIVTLSTRTAESTYPVTAVVNQFAARAGGTLPVGGGTIAYGARATLLNMREIDDAFSNQRRLLQTWEITGIGWRGGSGSAEVEVSAIVERRAVPIFRYAAFATHNGCGALSFAGGATTQSYDSANLGAGSAAYGGHVGTNGNLAGVGDPTVINGTLSTPRAGIGACTSSNVTAATTSGWATIQEGLVNLPQAVQMPTPAAPSPMPPTTNTNFQQNGGCPTTNPAPYCTVSTSGATITPPSASSQVVLGNVNVGGGAVLVLRAGTYILNSLDLTGNGTIVADTTNGAVIIQIAGTNENTPLKLAGGGVSNPSMDPTKLQFVYGGTGDVQITGGTDTAALVYAPRASASLSGNSTHFYGSIVTNKVTATGGVNLYYDRRLQTSTLTAGNPVMSTFSWRTF